MFRDQKVSYGQAGKNEANFRWSLPWRHAGRMPWNIFEFLSLQFLLLLLSILTSRDISQSQIDIDTCYFCLHVMFLLFYFLLQALACEKRLNLIFSYSALRACVGVLVWVWCLRGGSCVNTNHTSCCQASPPFCPCRTRALDTKYSRNGRFKLEGWTTCRLSSAHHRCSTIQVPWLTWVGEPGYCRVSPTPAPPNSLQCLSHFYSIIVTCVTWSR